MNFLRIALVAFMAVSLYSCTECVVGVGPVEPETRSVEPFDEIEINSYMNVSFRQIKSSEVDKVVVTSQENLLPYVKTTVDDEVLIIEVEGCIESDKEITVEIYGRNLRSLSNNGSGDFSADGKLELSKVYIGSNGSGDIDLKLQCQNLEVEINGSGRVSLDGAADYLESAINGSGDLKAEELRTFETELTLNGSGDAHVFAKQNLEVEINGSGDVFYKGKAEVSKSLNGTGTLKPF